MRQPPPLPSRPAWILAKAPPSACSAASASTHGRASKRSRSWKSRPLRLRPPTLATLAGSATWRWCSCPDTRPPTQLFTPASGPTGGQRSGAGAPLGLPGSSPAAVGVRCRSRCAARHAGLPDQNSAIAPSAPDQLVSARGPWRTSGIADPFLSHISAACWGECWPESLMPPGRPAAPQRHLISAWRGPAFSTRAVIHLLPQLGFARWIRMTTTARPAWPGSRDGLPPPSPGHRLRRWHAETRLGDGGSGASIISAPNAALAQPRSWPMVPSGFAVKKAVEAASTRPCGSAPDDAPRSMCQPNP